MQREPGPTGIAQTGTKSQEIDKNQKSSIRTQTETDEAAEVRGGNSNASGSFLSVKINLAAKLNVDACFFGNSQTQTLEIRKSNKEGNLV